MPGKLLPAYVASFVSGARQGLTDRANIISQLVIYSVLMIMFAAIYRIMPLEELGVGGLTWEKMLWYFAVTECLVVSGPGLATFGRMVSEGELTCLMTRPTGIMPLIVARLVGTHIAQLCLILTFAFVFLPVLMGAALPVPLYDLPLMVISLSLGAILYCTMGYMLGTSEILGPYSRPLGWIAGKFVFSFGGLFFPVSFFPPLLQKIAWATPFPYFISVPGSFMLGDDLYLILQNMFWQLCWVLAFIVIALAAERKMLRAVLENGD